MINKTNVNKTNKLVKANPQKPIGLSTYYLRLTTKIKKDR